MRFDPRLQMSPFTLFRCLMEGRAPMLVDVRAGAAALTFAGAFPAGPDWSPPADRDVLLFDGDGTAALEDARRLRAASHPRVMALFGGLELYEFALDPRVVGEERFLVSVDPTK